MVFRPYIKEPLLTLFEQYCNLNLYLFFHIHLQTERTENQTSKSKYSEIDFPRKWYELPNVKALIESSTFSNLERQQFKAIKSDLLLIEQLDQKILDLQKFLPEEKIDFLLPYKIRAIKDNLAEKIREALNF